MENYRIKKGNYNFEFEAKNEQKALDMIQEFSNKKKGKKMIKFFQTNGNSHDARLERQKSGGMSWECSKCGRVFNDLGDSFVNNCGGKNKTNSETIIYRDKNKQDKLEIGDNLLLAIQTICHQTNVTDSAKTKMIQALGIDKNFDKGRKK